MPHYWLTIAGSLLLVLATSGCATLHPHPGKADAHGPIPRRYTCVATHTPVMIDGRLDEPTWDAAAWTTPFVDIRGGEWPPPPHLTRAKLLWDATYLYIGAELVEPHLWGTLTRRDVVVWHDHDFEVFIDPDGDRRNYYELEFNALNTVFDLFLVRTYNDGGPALHGWDCHGLRSAVHLDGTLNDPADTDRGWSLEVAIPWAALREAANRPAPPAAGDTWRMNLSRVAWPLRVVHGRYEKLPTPREDNWAWSPQGVINMHLPEHWAYVTFAGMP